MDTAFLFFSGLVAFGLVFAIAFPDRICPDHPNRKKKKVGSSYWGVYKDADPAQSFGEVECAPLCDKQKTVYGAFQYSQGKGVSRRGA